MVCIVKRAKSEIGATTIQITKTYKINNLIVSSLEQFPPLNSFRTSIPKKEQFPRKLFAEIRYLKSRSSQSSCRILKFRNMWEDKSVSVVNELRFKKVYFVNYVDGLLEVGRPQFLLMNFRREQELRKKCIWGWAQTDASFTESR